MLRELNNCFLNLMRILGLSIGSALRSGQTLSMYICLLVKIILFVNLETVYNSLRKSCFMC